MSWTSNNPSTGTGGIVGGISSNSFTVIAWPRDTRKNFLNTFAVTDDMVVRVYDPTKAGINLQAVHTWDPIL